MSYVRVSWRKVRAGDQLKDPRGVSLVEYCSRWGWRPTGGIGLRNWPKVGRLKVIKERV